MKTLKADEFFKVGSLIGRLSEYLRNGADVAEKIKNKDTLTEKDKGHLSAALTNIQASAELIGANLTPIAVSELIANFDRDMTYQELKDGIRDIDVTFRREASLVAMYTMEPDLRDLAGDCDLVFGADFRVKIPSAVYDLEEACKCLAMARSTASVFHLMRIMEVLLRAIHACLGLPSPSGSDKNWGSMLQAIKATMTARNSNANAGWAAGDRQFFEDLYASIDAVRVAWRNTTMHIERRYDNDEAHHLLQVVKALSKKLANRCDEDGKPFA